MKFLIVDDDPDILKIAEKLVALQGYGVETCDTAMAAIDKLDDFSFDILVTDATMPAHSGFDLIRTVKRNPQLNYLTVAMLTGRKAKEDILQAAELGVQDYIVKPIEPTVFIEKINRLADQHKKKKKQKPQLTAYSMQVPIEINELTDIGINIKSPYPLAKGTVVTIDILELKEQGIEQNRFRAIFNSESKQAGFVNIELLLLDLDEKHQKKLSQVAKKFNSKKAA